MSDLSAALLNELREVTSARQILQLQLGKELDRATQVMCNERGRSLKRHYPGSLLLSNIGAGR